LHTDQDNMMILLASTYRDSVNLVIFRASLYTWHN